MSTRVWATCCIAIMLQISTQTVEKRGSGFRSRPRRTVIDTNAANQNIFVVLRLGSNSVRRGTAVGAAINSTAAPPAYMAASNGLTPTMFQHTRETVAEYVQRHFDRGIAQSLQIGVQVPISVRKVKFSMASASPYADVF